MRLLAKSDIQKKKNEDMSREAREGIKLTEHVSGLRELAAKEEQTLEKVRIASIENLNKELSTLYEERDVLKAEVKNIKVLREQGMKDVNDKLLSVASMKNALDEREANLELKIYQEDQREKELDVLIKNAKDEKERARTRTEEASYLRRNAANDRQQANLTLLNALDVQDRTIAEKERVEQYLTEKGAILDDRDKEIGKKEKELAKKEKILYTEKAQVNDMRGTLIRSMERLKKTGQP